MLKRGLYIIVIIGVLLGVRGIFNKDEGDLFKATLTSYTQEGRRGIAQGRSEWVGKTVLVYSCTTSNKIGELIGIYEIEGDNVVGNGDISIYNTDKRKSEKVFIQLVEADG